MSFAIEINDLNFSYYADKPILKNINLNIAYNKLVCIVGHNGSGKSTLSKLLTGLVLPQSGTIHVCDTVMDVNNIPQILNKLGLVFQNPDSQFVGITPEDDIAFGLENKKVPQHIIKKIIKSTSEFLNLTDILKINASLLSGGQKQKVAIASVLASDPQIIIFDETTSMLDKKNTLEIQEIMLNLVRKENKTVISITHDMEELLIADEIVIIKDGQVVLHDKDKSCLKNPELLIECNLTLPFNYALTEELKKKKINLDFADSEEKLLQEICDY